MDLVKFKAIKVLSGHVTGRKLPSQTPARICSAWRNLLPAFAATKTPTAVLSEALAKPEAPYFTSWESSSFKLLSDGRVAGGERSSQKRFPPIAAEVSQVRRAAPWEEARLSTKSTLSLHLPSKIFSNPEYTEPGYGSKFSSITSDGC